MNKDRKKERLNVVDENDDIIGEESRYNIHKQGLLHREVGIWLFTSKGEVIFQKRGNDQETFSGLLATTVGGHVALNEEYDRAALREIEEETGFKPEQKKLIFILKRRGKYFDESTGRINNRFSQMYI